MCEDGTFEKTFNPDTFVHRVLIKHDENLCLGIIHTELSQKEFSVNLSNKLDAKQIDIQNTQFHSCSVLHV